MKVIKPYLTNILKLNAKIGNPDRFQQVMTFKFGIRNRLVLINNADYFGFPVKVVVCSPNQVDLSPFRSSKSTNQESLIIS